MNIPKDSVSLELMRLYGKKNCNKCYGRGHKIVEFNPNGPIRRDQPVVQYVDYCDCVKKSLK